MSSRRTGSSAAKGIVLALSIALAASGLVNSGLIFTRAYLGMSNRNLVVAYVSPGSQAAAHGIETGDRILSVNGIPASRDMECRLELRELRAGDMVTLTLADEVGNERTVTMRGAPPPWTEIVWRFTNVIAGLLALALGFVIAFQRPEKLTLVFFGICFSIAFFLREPPLFQSQNLRVGHEILYNLLQVLLPALFVHFFILFPIRTASRRRRWLERLLYVPSLLIVAFVQVPTLLATGTEDDVLRRASLHLFLTTLYFVVSGMLAIGLFVRSFLKVRGRRERAQLRVALWGTILGITPLVITLILYAREPAADIPGLRYSVFGLLLIPASFAYAAFRHQVFDFEILIKRSVLYSVLTALLIAIYFGMVIGLGGLLHRLTGARNPLLSVVSVIAIALIAAPARARLQRFIDRMFFRQHYDARLTLRRFSHDLARMLELGGIATLLVERVVETLDLESAALLVAQSPGEPFAPVHVSPPAGGETPVLSEHVTVLFAEPGAESEIQGPAEKGGHDGGANPESGIRGEPGRHIRSGGDTARSRPVRLDRPQSARRPEFLLYEDRLAIQCYRSAVALPLWGRERLLGILLLGAPRAGAWTSQEDLELLETLGEQASIAIENALLHRSAIERERVTQELAVAQRIQAHLVPDRDPECDTIEFSGSTVASAEIGGDFYDYVTLDARHLGLAIGDVCGKGIPAALLMAGLQSSFRIEAERGGSPAEVLAAMNQRILSVSEQDRFVCFFYGVLDLVSRQIVYSNAGLDPPILVRAAGRVERLRHGGPALGVVPAARFDEGRVSLASGDTLALYTDGLIEPATEAPSGLGEARLIDFLVAHRDAGAAHLRERTLAWAFDLAGQQSLDDTTLIIARAR
jgi:sigma-B regulation protein RsbU (phosphoserine phosphatase)